MNERRSADETSESRESAMAYRRRPDFPALRNGSYHAGPDTEGVERRHSLTAPRAPVRCHTGRTPVAGKATTHRAHRPTCFSSARTHTCSRRAPRVPEHGWTHSQRTPLRRQKEACNDPSQRARGCAIGCGRREAQRWETVTARSYACFYGPLGIRSVWACRWTSTTTTRRRVWTLLARGASEEEIALHLRDVRRRMMEVGSDEHDTRAASKLWEWWHWRFGVPA